MKSIEVKMIEDDGADVARNGRIVYRIRTNGDAVTVTATASKAEKAPPRQFASMSGAISATVHRLVEEG